MTRNPTDRSKRSDDELRREAQSLGLPVGHTLSRDQLMDLLEGVEADEGEERAKPKDDLELSLPFLSTVTMATLYAQQGLEKEAADVCRAILARSPGEERARRLLDRLSCTSSSDETADIVDDLHRCCSPEKALGTSGPSCEAALPESYRGSTLVMLARSPTVVFVQWEIEGDEDSRIRRHAGEGAVRVLRLFSAWQGGSGLARRIFDTVIDRGRGELFLPSCQPGATVRAALGWRGTDERFLPVCHSSALRTPRRGAADRQRTLWSTVPYVAPVKPSASALIRLLDRLRPFLSMTLPWEDHRLGKVERSSREQLLADEEHLTQRAPSSWPHKPH